MAATKVAAHIRQRCWLNWRLILATVRMKSSSTDGAMITSAPRETAYKLAFKFDSLSVSFDVCRMGCNIQLAVIISNEQQILQLNLSSLLNAVLQSLHSLTFLTRNVGESEHSSLISECKQNGSVVFSRHWLEHWRLPEAEAIPWDIACAMFDIATESARSSYGEIKFHCVQTKNNKILFDETPLREREDTRRWY